MNPRKNKPFPQLPPRNPMWIDIIRLLAEHNASVHDVVHGHSLTTLNLVWQKDENRILEFFHFLQDQCYVDFSAEKAGAWSAFTSALRSPGTGLKCLKFLKERGVDFSKISADGRSLLHFGAELAHEPEVIEYLCETCPTHYVNRQDDLGRIRCTTRSFSKRYTCRKTRWRRLNFWFAVAPIHLSQQGFPHW